jgi:hypothetical protein
MPHKGGEKNVGKVKGLGVTQHASFAKGTHQKIRGGYAHSKRKSNIAAHRN